jgi:protein gp37
MSDKTSIAWTDHTFNPWWGCEKVSPGCAHCYAETFAARVGKTGIWGPEHGFRFFGDKHWAEPCKWDWTAEAEGRRHRVFCASMADVFEDRDELEPIRARLFNLIANTPHLDWQILTKRPAVAARWLRPWEAMVPNLWLGVSIENARWVGRANALRDTSAAVRFISAEPLLGPLVQRCPRLDCRDGIWYASLYGPAHVCEDCHGTGWIGLDLTGIDWLIIGGESGPHARPMDPQWVRDLIVKARAAGTAVFVKQMGGLRPGGPLPDEFNIREYPR